MARLHARALLSGGEEGAVDQDVRSEIQVGVFQHDGRILASHFELNAHFTPCHFIVERVADFARTCKRYGANRRVFDQRVTYGAPRARHVIHHARRGFPLR